MLARVESWSFLTNHARVLLCIAADPGARLRDIAASLGITERRAHSIVTGLAETGYVVRRKDGRRNRYEIQAHLPLPEPGGSGPPDSGPAVGEVLDLLAGSAGQRRPGASGDEPVARSRRPGRLATSGPGGGACHGHR
jgi:MarR family